MKLEPLTVAYDDWPLRGDQCTGALASNVVYLHGAGKSTREGLCQTREALYQRGIGSLAFDYLGHGETGGDLTQSSLAARARQLDAVMASCMPTRPCAVIGSSMGAYDAIRLSNRIEVGALLLIVPGIYDHAAFELPFGPRFSEVIRQPRSWLRSDAWDILASFRGHLLVISAEHDAVIPAEIPQRLIASANAAASRNHLPISGADHGRVFAHLKDTPGQFSATLDQMAATILGGVSVYNRC